MIEEPVLSTKEASSRYGGLLICGTNFGLPHGAQPKPEEPVEKKADYFTHPSHKNGDRFVSRLSLWFDWWGIPLCEDGHPTDLNHAISQTNLFYDSTTSFQLRPDKMEFAYTRLKKTLTRLNISGLLITSSRLVNVTHDRLALPEWRMVRSGRYWMGFASSGELRVAVCPHPTSPQSREGVEKLGDDMRQWIDEILKEQKKRLAER